MWHQGQSTWPCPGAFDADVREMKLDQLANSRGAIDVRNDFQKLVGRVERSSHCLAIEGVVLVAHSAGRNAHITVVQRANKRIDVGAQRWLRQLLGKTP